LTDNPFLGTWRLVSFEVRSAGDKVYYPWGENPDGYIMYTPQGYMSVSMMASDRPVFEARDLPKGTEQEKVAAADKYISYAGKYEVRDSKVYHHVDVSLFPNWVGGDQVRNFRFEDNRLLLSTDPVPGDEKQKAGYLIWERV
jgi:hypothetical protein